MSVKWEWKEQRTGLLREANVGVSCIGQDVWAFVIQIIYTS